MLQTPHSLENQNSYLQSFSERPYPPGPIRYRNMAEQIAAAIRQAIANGKLSPGSRLLEMKIAREMGTSRGPLREALFQLEREGWVVRKPNRGTFVIGLTEEVVRQIASLRGVLEGFAASLAVKRLGEEDFQRLERIISEMSAMARAGNFAALVECDYQFHEYIVHAAGHPLLHETWIGLVRKVRMYLSVLGRMYGNMNMVVKGHQVLLQALRRREAKRVNRIMADHIVEALDPIVAKALAGRKLTGPNGSMGSLDPISAAIGIGKRRKPAARRSR